MYQRFDLADLFWNKSGDNAIVLALVGSAICNYICSRKITVDHRTKIKKYERLYETRAIEVLKEVYQKATKELDEGIHRPNDEEHAALAKESSNIFR